MLRVRAGAGKRSGGQKQILAVARAIVEPRALLLIDEPSKGLAPSIIGNLVSVSILTWLVMAPVNRLFGFWLVPSPSRS